MDKEKKILELKKINNTHFQKYVSRVKKNYKIKIFVLFITLIFIFIHFFIYKYRKNNIEENNKLLKLAKISQLMKNKRQTHHFNKLKGVPDNKKFFDNLLSIMNKEEKYKGAKYCYYNDDDSCLYKYFCPKIVEGKNLKFYGFLADGGYVLTDDLNNINIAYSFGVDSEFSFELKLADNGIDSYMYDPTVKSLDFSKYNKDYNNFFNNNISYYQKKLHFFQIGIAHSKNKNNTMKTLEELMKINGHLNKSNMILKMDIESAEWMILKELSSDILKKFIYISFELHFGQKPEEYYSDIIKKLSKYHQVIFIRCNDWGEMVEFGYNRFCNCIELTYILKKGNKFLKDNSIYPLKGFNYNNGGNHKLDFDLNVFKLFYRK